MKRYIIALLVCVLGLNSCSDFLKEEPATKYPLEKYFNDEEETLLYLYGCYYQVKNTVFGPDFMYLTDTMTDNVDYTSTNTSRKQVAYLTLNSNNALVKNVWGKFYAVIEQCNILIDNLEKNPDLSPANCTNIMSEAKFIRAWAYFNLVQLWGDVPLVTKPVYSIIKDNVKPKRASTDDIYAFLITELETICPFIEEKPSAITVKSGISYHLTISRAAAKTLLGKIYLVRGQWEDVVETLSYFMSGEETDSRWGLCSQFNYIFDTRYKDVPERQKEILWEMEASAETGLNNTWHREVAPTTLKGPAGEKLLGVSAGYQSYIPTYDLFKEYSEKDQRYIYGSQLTNINRPQFMKGYDIQTANQNLGGANVILLRAADSYLTLSEAYARLGNPAMARKLMNIVRQRAGITEIDPAMSGEKLIDAILHERRLEFAGEGAYRLYDLRRTGKYLETMAAFNEKTASIMQEGRTEVFINPATGKKTAAVSVPFISVTKNAQPKHLLLPIPADERISNSNLTQNEGWN